MKQIVCMKWGTLYGADYVNKLYGMVKRNISGDFRFVCLTDDPTNVRKEVECLACPAVDIPAPFNNTGWRKITLWAGVLPEMSGAWLFLDLDVVITGDLNEFFSYKPELDFVVMKNWTQPNSGIGNTSVYRFKVGSYPNLLAELIERPLAIV
ncbi:MAG: glycosyl transferase, partial [Pseudomonadales bacterium]|nr:glycosyl transferase [Pseudomonadales bacterium]